MVWEKRTPLCCETKPMLVKLDFLYFQCFILISINSSRLVNWWHFFKYNRSSFIFFPKQVEKSILNSERKKKYVRIGILLKWLFKVLKPHTSCFALLNLYSEYLNLRELLAFHFAPEDLRCCCQVWMNTVWIRKDYKFSFIVKTEFNLKKKTKPLKLSNNDLYLIYFIKLPVALS